MVCDDCGAILLLASEEESGICYSCQVEKEAGDSDEL